MPRDYYEVLGVSRQADGQEIKKTFRRLARELHPDVNRHDHDAEERFKELAEAYEVLSDSDRRQTYDTYGHDGLRSGGFHSQAQDMGGISDLFNAFFGGDGFGGGRSAGRDGADVDVQIEITLGEVLTGVKREVAFEAASACERCDGDGAEPGTELVQCPTCGGAGELRRVSNTPLGRIVQAAPCDTCSGRGRRPETPCTQCRGEGREIADRTWEVAVPAGIESGQRIRVSGAGHVGEAGGRPGDLYVEVEIAEGDRFFRDGRDLTTVVDISAAEAMLGRTVAVPTLEGEETIELEAGVQPGAVQVLRARGLPDLRSARRGDLGVLVNVVIPHSLNAEQQDLARRLHETIAPDQLETDAPTGILGRLRRLLG
ncbi:MAG: molecular chaperone DnaJ [Solirubrobacterales bacterium]